MMTQDLDYKELWSNLKVVLEFSLGVEEIDKPGLFALMGKLEAHQVAQRIARELQSDRDIQNTVLGKNKARQTKEENE